MTEAPFSFSFLKGSQSDTIELTGLLIINHIEPIYTYFKDVLTFSKKIELKINAVSIDLTFLQLLLSLKKEYLNKNIDFIIQLSLPDDQQQLLVNAGFDNRFFN